MIKNIIEEAFTPEQVTDSISDQAHPPVILRKIIPWETVVNGPAPFYSDTEGRPGIPVRTAAALFIIQKLRGLSGRETVNQVKENRYIQYFCNVPDSGLPTFIHHSSLSNIKNLPPETVNVFMGRTSDVCEEKQEFCLKARSATEGFIAAAKNLRGFGRCLYSGLKGHRIWSLLCQTAYNLKKFLQLYFADGIKEESLIKLGLA